MRTSGPDKSRAASLSSVIALADAQNLLALQLPARLLQNLQVAPRLQEGVLDANSIAGFIFLSGIVGLGARFCV